MIFVTFCNIYFPNFIVIYIITRDLMSQLKLRNKSDKTFLMFSIIVSINSKSLVASPWFVQILLTNSYKISSYKLVLPNIKLGAMAKA